MQSSYTVCIVCTVSRIWCLVSSIQDLDSSIQCLSSVWYLVKQRETFSATAFAILIRQAPPLKIHQKMLKIHCRGIIFNKNIGVFPQNLDRQKSIIFYQTRDVFLKNSVGCVIFSWKSCGRLNRNFQTFFRKKCYFLALSGA